MFKHVVVLTAQKLPAVFPHCLRLHTASKSMRCIHVVQHFKVRPQFRFQFADELTGKEMLQPLFVQLLLVAQLTRWVDSLG